MFFSIPWGLATGLQQYCFTISQCECYFDDDTIHSIDDSFVQVKYASLKNMFKVFISLIRYLD